MWFIDLNSKHKNLAFCHCQKILFGNVEIHNLAYLFVLHFQYDFVSQISEF